MMEKLPHIGKNVIETLTLGMYEDARFIFREYIQNAADQIDVAVESNILKRKIDGKIHIKIDPEKREIRVEDNATGINSKNVLKFLGDVANSSKDMSQRKGFRGIGRLGGLGYCERLIFETSFFGENVMSRLSMDAKQLRKIILDKNNNEAAASVISVITNITQVKAEKNEHYFKVILEEVTNPALLNTQNVIEYLSLVAPVPFRSDFSYASEIRNFFESNNVILDEYDVRLNKIQLEKAYKNNFNEGGIKSKLLGVDFFDIRSDDNELLALGWFGFRDLSNILLDSETIEKGIRLRKNNIAIGNEVTLQKFFPSARTSLRFIGEIHVVSTSFIPNARRDYFNDNKTCQIFEQKLKSFFRSVNLENKIGHTASKLHNRLKEIEEYKTALSEFETEKEKIENPNQARFHEEKVKKSREKALKAVKDIEKLSKKASEDKNVKKLYENIVGKKDITVDTNLTIKVTKGYKKIEFKKLNKDQSKIVLEIFKLLESTLSYKEAEDVKAKIIKKYN